MVDIVEVRKNNTKVYPKTHRNAVENLITTSYELIYQKSNNNANSVGDFLSLPNDLSKYSWLRVTCHVNSSNFPFTFETNRSYAVGYAWRKHGSIPENLLLSTIEFEINRDLTLPRIKITSNNTVNFENFVKKTSTNNDIRIETVYGVIIN